MPTSDSGKAIASRNATTHGLFARDVVLPALGEDPSGYHQLEAAWLAQLPPRTLLERHYVEKIAAASWRLRRLHRWQAQLFEDATLTEHERIDRLDKVLRHETALQRQIDTAVRMLNRDASQLFAQRAREQVQEDLRLSERECREDFQDGMAVELEVQNRLLRIRKAAEQAANELSVAPIDPHPGDVHTEICENERTPAAEPEVSPQNHQADEDPAGNPGEAAERIGEKCQNEPAPVRWHPRRVTEYFDLDPDHRCEADHHRRRPQLYAPVR